MRASPFLTSLAVLLSFLGDLFSPPVMAQTTVEQSIGMLYRDSMRWYDGAYANHYYFEQRKILSAQLRYDFEVRSPDFDPVILLAGPDGRIIADARGVRGRAAAQLTLPPGLSGEYSIYVTSVQNFATGNFETSLHMAPVRAPADRLQGIVWEDKVDGLPVATQWKFTRLPDGTYKAKQRGLGEVEGTAVLNGDRVRITFHYGAETGIYDWDLTNLTGVLYFRGTRTATLKRTDLPVW
jgi:hypothetical protein